MINILQKKKVPLFIKNIFNPKLRIKMREIELNSYWYLSGMQDPPIYSYKRKIIGKISKGQNIENFVETGTFGGDTTQWASKRFKNVYSVELDKTLADKAKIRFGNYPNVSILQGDSAEKITEIMDRIKSRAVFWLDGHYSGEGTALSNIETPILEELRVIFQHQIKNHLILIDDARCFDGTHDYPTLEDLKKFIVKNRPTANVEIIHDIIVIKI